jgi:tetratricopeptide (TPR) repeat protein
MNATSDHLRSELERLFELDELKALSSNLLGLSPDEVGGAAGKATFARALVERVSEEGSTAALLDAMVFSKKGVKELDAASGEDLAAGTTLEGWKILKKLGEGGVGVTYLAEKGSERAAVKVVRFLHARDKGASRRWLVAQRALAQLDDKGLAKVLASGVLADGRPWVATSFVEGQLLGARIARTGPMHFNEARPIVRGVLSALEVLHARGLAHGNVKMENVFVVRPQSDKGASEPTGVLVDAAADRLVARNGAPSSAGQAGVFPVAGSAKAIAPEHARLGRAVPSADVYAVGTLLYEVLTGKLPFSGESAFEVLARHLTTDPEAPSSVAPRGWVSKELDAIVLRALAKNPADRFASASALREALEMIGRVSVPPEARKKEALDQAAFDKAKAALLAKPSDEELAAALERIAAPAEEWKLATDALVAASDKVEEKEAKKALLFRAARLLESDAKDHAGAEGIYKKLLEIDGEDEIARAGLEELKRHSGDAEGLVELLLEKVEREKTAHDRAAVLREIAETYENQLKDEDNAYVAYVQALSEDPRHETTVSAIERLAKGKNERWNEAIGALNEAVAAADGRADKVAMYVLMGRWYADELGRPDFALPCYSQAVTLDPASEDALDGTVALYRKAQSYPELAAILLKRAEVASPTKARDFKAEAAEILHRRLNDGKRATDLYEQILADDAAHPKATEALEMLYSERKEWDGLVKLLEKKAQGQRGADRVDTLCALAEVYEDRLSKLDEAATQYEAALAESPKLVPALKGLERIYAQKGRYDALLKNLETQLETVATPRQRIGIWERIGGIQEEEFVDHKAGGERVREHRRDRARSRRGERGARAGVPPAPALRRSRLDARASRARLERRAAQDQPPAPGRTRADGRRRRARARGEHGRARAVGEARSPRGARAARAPQGEVGRQERGGRRGAQARRRPRATRPRRPTSTSAPVASSRRVATRTARSRSTSSRSTPTRTTRTPPPRCARSTRAAATPTARRTCSSARSRSRRVRARRRSSSPSSAGSAAIASRTTPAPRTRTRRRSSSTRRARRPRAAWVISRSTRATSSRPASSTSRCSRARAR